MASAGEHGNGTYRSAPQQAPPPAPQAEVKEAVLQQARQEGPEYVEEEGRDFRGQVRWGAGKGSVGNRQEAFRSPEAEGSVESTGGSICCSC